MTHENIRENLNPRERILERVFQENESLRHFGQNTSWRPGLLDLLYEIGIHFDSKINLEHARKEWQEHLAEQVCKIFEKNRADRGMDHKHRIMAAILGSPSLSAGAAEMLYDKHLCENEAEKWRIIQENDREKLEQRAADELAAQRHRERLAEESKSV